MIGTFGPPMGLRRADSAYTRTMSAYFGLFANGRSFANADLPPINSNYGARR
jgi:hypothetical protein